MGNGQMGKWANGQMGNGMGKSAESTFHSPFAHSVADFMFEMGNGMGRNGQKWANEMGKNGEWNGQKWAKMGK